MLSANTIKLALRKMKRRPLISLLKISGLAISISVVVLMVLYVDFQWRYDHFHEKKDRIYRVATEQYHDGQLNLESAMTYAGVGPLLASEFPEVEEQVRLAIWIGNDIVFQYEDRAVREKAFYYTEPSFFEIFSIRLKNGDPKTALSQPNSVVLTEEIAQKLFGEEDPLGKVIQQENRLSFTVTGVIEQAPEQSHLKYGILASYATWDATGFADTGVYGDNHFEYLYTYTYALLHPRARPDEMAQQLTNRIRAYKEAGKNRDNFLLQPLTDIHLYSNLQYEMQATVNGRSLWVLLAIAMIVVVLAWVNYYNITMATALDQRSAIGVRKVIGARRRDIVLQMFVENLLHTLFALVLGVGFALWSIPLVERLFGISLGTPTLFAEMLFTPMLAILLFIGIGTILSTLLPAFSMSSINPINLFRKSVYFSTLGMDARKVLVVLQFMIIIGLLTSSMVIYQQSRYMEQKDLGINLENILIVKGPLGTAVYADIQPAHLAFKNRIQAIPSVGQSTMSRQIPGDDLDVLNELRFKDGETSFPVNRLVVSPSFFQIYELSLIAGDVSRVERNTQNGVVLNESAVRHLGYRENEEILGRTVHFYDAEHEVVGVLRDYHHYSLHQPVPPILFDLTNSETDGLEDGYFSIKMNTPEYFRDIPEIEAAFKASYPGTVFEYFTMAETYERLYKANNDFSTLHLIFTGLAFLIACIGLLALSIILAEKRTKEIGIRKILGATVLEILLLFSRDFLKLVAIGWVIAVPISWYALRIWLQNFAFRVEIGWWPFLLAGLATMLLTAGTIGMNALKTARTNPVNALREHPITG